jgi:tetratricopeptide (TPR) repeat protein
VLVDRLEGLLDTPGPQFAGVLDTGLRGYPFSPSLHLLGAARAIRTDHASSARWMNVALRSAPAWPSMHEQAAYFLERRGNPLQAASEISEALTYSPLYERAACSLLLRHPSARLAWEAAPRAAPQKQRAIESLAQCLIDKQLNEPADLLLTEIVDAYPSSDFAHERLVNLALQAKQFDLAEQRATAFVKRFPNLAKAQASLMRVLIARDRPEEALQLFDGLSGPARQNGQVLQEASWAAARLHNVSRLQELVQASLSQASTNVDALVHVHFGAITFFDLAGAPEIAVSHAQRAYDITSRPEFMERVQQLAPSAGLPSLAWRAALELCHVGYRRDLYCKLTEPGTGAQGQN